MHKRLGNESGQGLLEYIALISLSFVLVFGIVYKFSDAFRQYTQAWFGSESGYLFCLIENAALPGDDGCQDQMPKFDIASGKPKNMPVASSSSGGSTANSSSASKSSSSSKGGSETKKSGSSNESSSASSGRGSRDTGGNSGLVPTGSADFGGRGGRGFASQSNSSEKSSGAKQKGGSRSEVDLTALGGNSSEGSGSTSRVSSNASAGALSRGNTTSANNSIPVNERDLKTAREIAAERIKKRKADEEVSPFTFINFVRWIIIIALILLLLFFVGSQFVAAQRGSKRR